MRLVLAALSVLVVPSLSLAANAAVVPEPALLGLVAVGAGALGLRYFRK